ncbi:MAG: plastocyanin/azurin family copper-binding protein [Acidimicrobiales bacterium]|nr:plastocyanin/azurin family copper-binding protein [Acidimicrobiales bacterium]MDP6650068.1 plastocyanin/azurin family copper-binding protein [Acidimicrobiales bacterium]MDP6760067.1 plastocyanin/azurin family copper-binding protein [Acidimicrobiales bacterium]
MKHKTPRPLLATSLLTLVALLTTACGGGGGDGTSTSPVGSGSSLSIKGTEFLFEPGDFSIKAGQEFTVTLDNDGVVEHSFSILKAGNVISAVDEYSEDLEIPGTAINLVGPDESGSVTFTIADAGRYQFICALPGHLEAGMKGNLTVS